MPQKTRKKSKGGCFGFFLVLLLLLVVLGGVAFAGYHTFLPAKMTFGAAELNTINSTYDEIDGQLDRFEATNLKPFMEKPFNQEMEFGIQLESTLLEKIANLDAASAKSIVDIVNGITVKIATAGDFSKKQSSADFGTRVKGNPFLGMNITMDRKVLGLQLPELSSTRIKADLSNPAVVQRFSSLSGGAGVDSSMMPSEMAILGSTDPWVSKSIYDEVAIDRDALKKLVLDYSMALYNAIPSSSMSIDRSVVVEVLGKKQTLKEVTIDMTPEEFKTVVLKIMEKIEKDDKFYNLFIVNLDHMLRITGESNPEMQLQLESMRDQLTRDAFRDSVTKARTEYEAADLSVSDGSPNLIIKAYIDGYKVVRHAVELTGDPGEDTKVIIGMDRVKQGDKISQRFNITGGNAEEKMDIRVNWSTEFKSATNTHNFILDAAADMAMTDMTRTVALTFNAMETPGAKNEADRKVDGILRANMGGSTPFNGTFDIRGGGKVTRDAEGKTTGEDQSFDVSMQTDALSSPINLKVFYKLMREYAKAFSMPTDTGATLDLATASDEDLGAYAQEITPKLQELFSTLMPAAGE